MCYSQLSGLVLCHLNTCIGVSPFFPLLLRGDRVTEATYKQIKMGMTLNNVRDIVGMPGRDYSTPFDMPGPSREIQNIHEAGKWNPKPDDNTPGKRWVWYGWDTVLMIRLGKEGEVADKMIILLKPLGSINRVRQVIGW